MPAHGWTILCERAEIDPVTQVVSLIKIIDDVTVTATPNTGPVVAVVDWRLVTLWRRKDRAQPETFEHRTQLRRPDGALTDPVVFAISLDPFLHARAIATLTQFTVFGPGLYEILIAHRKSPDAPWVEAAIVPLSVVFQAPVG